MINKLYMFANFGNLKELPCDGGQSSSRRIKSDLEKNGFEVRPIVRHLTRSQKLILRRIEVFSFMILNAIKIFFILLFGKRKNSVFINLTYNGPFVVYELAISKIARFLGYKSTMYAKGGLEAYYYGKVYGRHNEIFKRLLNEQAVTFFEGMEVMSIAASLTESRLEYFPNYVREENIPTALIPKPNNKINICYFGRIDENKHVDVIVTAFEILCQKYDNIYLTIVGGVGRKDEFVSRVDDMIAKSSHSDHIIRKGLSSSSYLYEMLKTQHFFLFPTDEHAEGHSNSLNEAMSHGVIPVVSKHNCNQSVVGDYKLVVEGFNPQSYAERIEELINKDNLKVLSEEVWNRVRTNYTDNIVIPHICKVINQISSVS